MMKKSMTNQSELATNDADMYTLVLEAREEAEKNLYYDNH